MPPLIPHPEPGVPDTRGPLRYMWWLVRCQPWRVLRGTLFGTSWMIGLSVRPFLIARAIDEGLRKHDPQALLRWVLAILVAGIGLAYLGIMRHRTMTFVREDASTRSAEVMLRQLATVGAVLPRKLAAGEVATVGGSDIRQVSNVLTMTGPGVGAALAYGVVAAVLWSVSPLLAVFVLLGVPAIAVLIGPLLRRLEGAESAYRHQQGQLTMRSGDIVAGLRVLAGVGGRGLFARRYVARSQGLLTEGYRVGAVASWIEALTITIPGLFLAAVVWLAARMAADGDITIGQMVAVYGYVAILIVPVWFLLEGGHDLIRGRVAARRILAVLNVSPDPIADPIADPVAAPGPVAAPDPVVPAPDRPAELHDPATGVRVRVGQFLAIAADDPAEAIALADRLGRFERSAVTWGGVPLCAVALAQVRARILVADHDSYLFAGTLREILHVRSGLDDAQIRASVRTASAEDVVDALPHGLSSPVGARARTLSGGERQRIRLARALLTEPEVLLLLDPTSAVDAHTEARIAQRLREARAGRTTVVFATSPLLLGRADVVLHLRGGRITAAGTHSELLQTCPAYRALVSRDYTADTDDSADSVGAVR